MKLANNLVSFLLELAMLGALAFWGFHATGGTLSKWLLGIGAPVLVIVFWGLFMAPSASHRIAWPWLPLLSFALFFGSAALLYMAGARGAATAFAITAVINCVLVFIWRQY